MKNTFFTIIFIALFTPCCVLANESPSIAVADLLNEHGQMNNKHHLSGSVDFSGFMPVIDDCKGLLFLPMPVVPGWNALGTGLGSTVRAITISGSDIYVGGFFTDAGGNPNADFIARWDGSSWNSLGVSSAGLGSGVFAIAISGSNIYVGGQFTDFAGNANADRIARWDGSTWHALGTGLGSNVFAITISGSDIYVGGDFTDAGGNVNADRIARWDGSIWQALGTGLGSGVRDITISGSDIYVGGSFTDAGGNVNADRIARWDGSTWHALGMGLGGNVLAIEISGSNVYVGGAFMDAGGNVNADFIARWDGSTWHALGMGLGGSVSALAISGSNVYVGGSFTDAGGNVDADRIARWDGSTWHALGMGLGGTVNALAISDNNMFVGGAFTDAGGNPDADRIVRWEGTPLPVELVSFEAKRKENAVQLDWLVANQTSNEGWYIEHSIDGASWERVGWVNGDGDLKSRKNYGFLHQNPAAGANYYRLLQMDVDGLSEFSRMLSINVDGEDGLSVYPTLTTGVVRFKGDLEQLEEIAVYDAFGSLRMSTSQTNEIDLSAEMPGVYYVQILYNGKPFVRRVVKQ